MHCRSNLKEAGAEIGGDFASLELGGMTIALLHGEDEGIVEALAESENYDAVVRGHTHGLEISEDPLIINPGHSSK